jgi:ABC-2 type transport system permease protein
VTEAVVSAGRPAQGTRGTWRPWPGLPDALHAEWTKLRTLASTWWLLLAAGALTVVVSAAVAAAYRCSPGAAGGCSPAATGADPAKISLTGVYLGQVIVALLAVLAVGGEYGTGMIRVTLAATPRRMTMLAAKALVVTGWALVAGLAGVAGSLLAGRLILPGHGLSAANGYVVPSLSNGADLRAFGGSVLYLVLIALLALGVTTAVRDSAVAIGLVLGVLYLFTIIASIIPNQHLARHLQQIAPMTTGLYIQATVDLRSLPLTPWQGLGVMALWAVGALLLGAAVLCLRDA